MTLELASALYDKVKSNKSVLSIFKKTIATTHRALRSGLIEEAEYQKEYNRTLYRCSMMID